MNTKDGGDKMSVKKDYLISSQGVTSQVWFLTFIRK